jgi:hypothetical protein
MNNGHAPAYPRPHSWDESPVKGWHEGDHPEAHSAQEGLTKRELIAAKLMPSCVDLAADFEAENTPVGPGLLSNTVFMSETFKRAAAFAVFGADALLAELAKPAPARPENITPHGEG